ncbi:Abort lactococcal phage infection AbiTii [Nitrincola lacisaponensis]|uniref:Abort lactococcal phage infection AbiTii n=1 Tax=Nitrincola lacisaponensis TaxID=267850 RepID=A0A063Y020_9GAMM|nr:Abort lactococcal phage infection AbiTii [Nitrincola lacisaponensis]
MSLLQQIQESVVQEGADLGSILLKLRLLAARLGSDTLEEWVKHESEGYPMDANVPDYRIVGVTYRGTFSGPFGSGIKNAQIPPYLIEKHAGESWTKYEVRESIAAVDEMVRRQTSDGGDFGIDASNLILLLQGKIYKGYACNDVSGLISPTSFYEIQQAVRSRILELTIEFERSVPGSVHVAFGTTKTEKKDVEQVQQISQQIIYGNVSTAVAGGSGSRISVAVNERDGQSFIEHLVKSGIPEKDASELAEIIATEEPSSVEEPFGQQAKKWLGSNLKKAAEGTWSVGVSVATKVLTEAALKYYGLK